MKMLSTAISLALIIVGQMLFHASAQAAESVKVGIVNATSADSFAETNLRNYTINYLDEIAKQTNLQFEYYFGTMDECRQKLNEGQVQLISSVTESAARGDNDLLLGGYTCYNLLSLWTRADSTMNYDEPATINRKRVGIVDYDSVRGPFSHFVAANEWHLTLVPFRDGKSAAAALEAGTVDAIVDDGTSVGKDAKMVVPFATVTANFMTTKSNAELAEEINRAITVIETRNPFFETWLEQEFLDPAIQHIARFSTVERAYIKNAPTFKAAFLPGCMPLYDLGNPFADAGGVYVDFLNLMTSVAELKVNFEQFPSTLAIEDALKSGAVDMTFAIYNRSLAEGVYFSNDIRKESFVGVKRRRGDADNNVIAVPMVFVGIKDFFAARFPDKTVRQYNTIDDCLNAVENGKCNAAYVPTLYLMYENALVMRPNLTYHDEDEVHVPVCLAVSAKTPQGLTSVMNTAALLMTKEQKRGVMFKNARPPFSFSYILSQYPLPAAMVLSFVIFGGAATMLVLFRSRMQERQNFMLSIKNAELQAALDAAENMRKDRDIYKNEAETDRLTGLVNKVAMENICHIRISKLPAGITGALYIIDLDHFKEANDTYGHQHGDDILVSFARSLRSIFRSTDAVARFGGDEFVVFIAAIPDPRIIERQARHILQIARSIILDGKNAGITASVGIALTPQHGLDYDDIFRIADRALYNVKENGRDGYCIYQQEIVR